MAGMRKVQPKMKALQERYKDDKPRLQQEMLKLYQEEKINPAAGCLPILLQIPIFYALYKVLMVSVEMRHQPFALWIKDLSRARPADPGQPVRPARLHPAGLPRDRRAADPARRHHVDPVQAQSAADGPGPAADLQLHAVDPDVRHGAVRGRPAALLGGLEPPHDRPADVALQALRHCTSPTPIRSRPERMDDEPTSPNTRASSSRGRSTS